MALCLASCGNQHGTTQWLTLEKDTGSNPGEPPAKAAFKRANGIAQSS